MPLSAVSRTLLKALLRFTKKPMPIPLRIRSFPIDPHLSPLRLPGNVDTIVNRRALRHVILFCFRSTPATPRSIDTGFFYLRQLVKWQEDESKKSAAIREKVELHSLLNRRYEIGDVVLHNELQLRGICVGWDIDPSSGKQTLRIIFDTNDCNPRRIIPRKKISLPAPDESVQAWRAASNYTLVTDPLLQRVQNSALSEYFTRFDSILNRFVPTAELQQLYPMDTKHVSLHAHEDLNENISTDESNRYTGGHTLDVLSVNNRIISTATRVSRHLKGLHARLTDILLKAVPKQDVDAERLFRLDDSKTSCRIPPGTRGSMLSFLGAMCRCVDGWGRQSTGPNPDQESLFKLSDTLRVINAGGSSASPVGNKDTLELIRLEHEILKDFNAWREKTFGPAVLHVAYRLVFSVHYLYGVVQDMLFRRYRNRLADLVDELNVVRTELNGGSATPRREREVIMEAVRAENAIKANLSDLFSQSRSPDYKYLPGEIVFHRIRDCYYVCVEGDRCVMSAQRQNLGENYWRLIPLYIKDVDDAHEEGLEPPLSSADGPSDDASRFGEVVFACEDDLDLCENFDLNRTPHHDFRSRGFSHPTGRKRDKPIINTFIYQYFSSFDSKRGRFVPFVDVALKHGLAVDMCQATLADKEYHISYRKEDVVNYDPPNTSCVLLPLEALLAEFSAEDNAVESVLMRLFVTLHGELCAVKHDLLNIEPLNTHYFHSDYSTISPRQSKKRQMMSKMALNLSDLHAMARHAPSLYHAADVHDLIHRIQNVHPSYALSFLNEEADLMLKLGYPQNALNLFNELIVADDAFWAAHCGKAHAQSVDSTRRALGGMAMVVASRPDAAGAWASLGTINCCQGDRHEAISCFERVLMLTPWSGPYQTALSTLLQEQGTNSHRKKGIDSYSPYRLNSENLKKLEQQNASSITKLRRDSNTACNPADRKIIPGDNHSIDSNCGSQDAASDWVVRPTKPPPAGENN